MRVTAADAPAIVAIVRDAFAREALRYDVDRLPPMSDTAEELETLLADHVVLKAVEGDRIVGTVRGTMDAECCEIGRLAVAADREGLGIAQALMREIEAACPSRRYAIFTGSLSTGPLHIYGKLGYREVRRERIPAGVELVHMEKLVSE